MYFCGDDLSGKVPKSRKFLFAKKSEVAVGENILWRARFNHPPTTHGAALCTCVDIELGVPTKSI
jgi:hypothetical protein